MRSDADAIWTVFEPTRCTSAGGATLRNLPDRSILAGGENPSPDTFQFVLQQGSPAGHNLGRLRLSVTAAKRPMPSPTPSGPRSLVVKGDVPPCAQCRLLLRVLEVRDLAALVKLKNIREDGEHLLERTRLAKNAGVVNALKQGMPDATVRNPIRELSKRAAQ